MIKAKNGITGKIDFSGTDAAAVLQRSINALSSTGGSIILRSGTYVWESVPALPKDLPNWLKIVGESGAIIKLTEKGPRAFDFNKVADYDTFQNIWLESFTVDCNNIGGKNHVVLGTYIGGFGSEVTQTRINIQDIRIRCVNTVNVPVDPTTTNHRLNVWLAVKHPAPGETQTNIQRVLIEDCTFLGGNAGIGIIAERGGPAATGYNVFIDDIYINRCFHSMLTVPTTGFASSNFHIANFGFGGSCCIRDCYGEYSGDDGVEINSMTNALVENTTIRDAFQQPYYFTNKNNPARPTEQKITLRNCVAQRIGLTSTNDYDIGFFFKGSAETHVPMGTVRLEDCQYYTHGTSLGYGAAISVNTDDGMTALTIDGFKVAMDSITNTAGANMIRAIYIYPRGGTLSTPVSIKNVHLTAAGSVAGGTLEFLGMFLSGVMDLDIDDVTFDVNITHITNYGTTLIAIGSATSTIDGTIKRVKVLRCQDDPHPTGFSISGTATLTINNAMIIEQCDFAALGINREIIFEGVSNATKVYLNYNIWATFPKAA
jgi:hypothetical protein